MSKFKIGDRIEVTEVSDGEFFAVGDTGTVIRIDYDGDPWVRFDASDTVFEADNDRVWCIEEKVLDKCKLIT